jgi:hypothetical protein
MTKGEAKRGYRKAVAEAKRARDKAVTLAAKLGKATTPAARDKILETLTNVRMEASAREEQAQFFFDELRRLTE